jgi:hypothetical protein
MTKVNQPSFRSKAQREQDIDLQAKYGELGNPHVKAAVMLTKKPASPSQMQMVLNDDDQD